MNDSFEGDIVGGCPLKIISDCHIGEKKDISNEIIFLRNGNQSLYWKRVVKFQQGIFNEKKNAQHMWIKS